MERKRYFVVALIICMVLSVAMSGMTSISEAFELLSNVSSTSVDKGNVTVTFDPSGKELTNYSEYMGECLPIVPFKIEKNYETPNILLYGKGEKGNFLVIVNSQIQGSIQPSLNRYKTDLELDGYIVSIYTTSGGTPNELRAFLQEQSTGLVGAILIGDLPVAWYELDNQPEPWLSYEDFPCDLYYMDLDGTWTDTNPTPNCQPGVFDGHSGDTAPEIWIGRLTVNTLGSNETTLLTNYFEKNHNYRMGSPSLNNRSLVYIDDDWVSWANGVNNDVGLAYSTTVLVMDKATTCRDDYRDIRLKQNYMWMHVMLHSNYLEHFFKVNDEWEMEDPYTHATVSSADIQRKDPTSFFYNLYACYSCRFIENEYIGGWYIFADTYGLAAVGSTKTGGMWALNYFYAPLGQGECIGEALKEWFISQYPYDDEDCRYYYGMTLLGDPTLTIKAQNKLPTALFTYSPENPVINQTITFDASNSTDLDGTITKYKWNFGDGNITNTTEKIITHSYASAGNYTVSLTVTDNKGAKNTTAKTITVLPLEKHIFDTGPSKNPYPSIMGTHKGEIKPSDNINVSKLYTYSCVGTGGHTESIELYENDELIASGTWNGYQDDYHNISITPSVILQAERTYNYTIVTGSYPQIIHATSKEVTGGTITGTSFVDANGKTYTDWIPAIRLE